MDSSALFALLDEDDQRHRDAMAWLAGPGQDPDVILVSHNYVIIESAALAVRRLGIDAVRVLLNAFVPALSVLYVDEHLHLSAVSAYLGAGARRPSLVDRVSFEMMRSLGISAAFAFDRDFQAQGFTTVP